MTNYESECLGHMAGIEDSINSFPEEDRDKAWGMFSMHLCNVRAALVNPNHIEMGIATAHVASVQGMGLLSIAEREHEANG